MEANQLNLEHPLVKFVLSCKNCNGRQRKTDLANRIITNPDAIIILLYALGPLGLNEIRTLSKAWKGTWALQTYFGPTMGYVGASFMSRARYTSPITGYSASGGNSGYPLWFRSIESVPGVRRYANALSLDGSRRLQEMLPFLPKAV
jgi:hypothetical protein